MLGYQSNIGWRRDVGRWSDVRRRRRGRAGVQGFRRKFVARLAVGAKTAYQPLDLLLGRDRPVFVLAQLLAGSTCRPPFKPIEHCTILQSPTQPSSLHASHTPLVSAAPLVQHLPLWRVKIFT